MQPSLKSFSSSGLILNESAGLMISWAIAFSKLSLIQGEPLSHLDSGPIDSRVTWSGLVPVSQGLWSVLTWNSLSNPVPLLIWRTRVLWKMPSLLFSEIVQHKAILESPKTTSESTQSWRALLIIHFMFEAPHRASSSSLGMVEFSSARRFLPSKCWQDQEPSDLSKLPQAPIMMIASAASAPTSNLILVFFASTGMIGLLNLRPLNCSNLQNISTHLLLKGLGIGSSHPTVCWFVSLSNHLAEASRGPSFCLRS